MCGGGGSPAPAPVIQDNSAEVARIQAEAQQREREAAAAEAQRQREQAAAAEAAKRDSFTTSLNAAYQAAINEATRYFQSMGLDPAQYAGVITEYANSKKGQVPDLDTSPGTHFNNLGQIVYNSEQDAARAKAQRDIDTFASQGFEKNLIADTSDDAFINSLLEENFDESSTLLNNQLTRGVFTDTGYAEALKELTRQKSGAKSNLDAIGTSILETGRGTVRNKAADARSAASSFNLGSNFDPFSYQKAINDDVTNFFAGLEGNIRGAAPDDLFDVSRAFSKGGIGQGAQNTGYDPLASNGVFTLFDEEAEKKKKEQSSTPALSPF